MDTLLGYQFNPGHIESPHPNPLPSLGEGARDSAFGSGSPSPKLGRRGWGMRASNDFHYFLSRIKFLPLYWEY
jgi:hypothetical protein